MQQWGKQALTPRIQRRINQSAARIDQRAIGHKLVDCPRDHPIINKNIGSDLQHRRTPITARELLHIGFGCDHGHLNALPCQTLQAHHLLRLLRKRRNVIVMQDQVCRAHSECSLQCRRTLTPSGVIVKGGDMSR